MHTKIFMSFYPFPSAFVTCRQQVRSCFEQRHCIAKPISCVLLDYSQYIPGWKISQEKNGHPSFFCWHYYRY